MSSRNNLDDDDNEDEERATRLQALQDKYLVGRPSFAASSSASSSSSSSSSDRLFPPASARAPNKLDIYGAEELSQLFELHQTLQPQEQHDNTDNIITTNTTTTKTTEAEEAADDDVLLPSSFRSGSKDKKKKTPIVPGRPELVPLSLHELVMHTLATIEEDGVVDRDGDRNGSNTEATNNKSETPPPPEAATATMGITITTTTDDAPKKEDSSTTNITTSKDDNNNPEDEWNSNSTASLVPTLTGTEIEHLLTHWEEDPTGRSSPPLIIEAMASWCSPCQRLVPELVAAAHYFRSTGTGTTSKAVRFVQFDTDIEPALSDRLQIQGLPTLLFLTTEHLPHNHHTTREDDDENANANEDHDPSPNTTTTKSTTKVALKVRIEGGLRTESIIRLAEHHFFAGPKPESLHFL